MAVKKIMSPEAHAEAHFAKRKFRDLKFVAKVGTKDHLLAKHVRRRTKVDHAIEEHDVIALTEADVTRIEAICERGTVITDHVWAAIANPWKAAGV